MIDKDASLRYEMRQHVFFQEMSDDELSALLAITHSKTFKSRRTIVAQGDPGDSLFVILSGRIKVFTTSTAGKETVLSFMGPGDVLGEIAVLDGGVRTASATVIEEVRALELPRSRFVTFLESRPKLALHIIKVLCGRLRATDMFVEEMTTLQSGPRLARALLRLAEQYGKDNPGGGILVDIKLSQANLGAHAGLMRENVNRQLKLWEDEGLLAARDGHILINDPAALEDIAGATL